jgi:hypothetical protein
MRQTSRSGYRGEGPPAPSVVPAWWQAAHDRYTWVKRYREVSSEEPQPTRPSDGVPEIPGVRRITDARATHPVRMALIEELTIGGAMTARHALDAQ